MGETRLVALTQPRNPRLNHLYLSPTPHETSGCLATGLTS
jgi:hypothetical protein